MLTVGLTLQIFAADYKLAPEFPYPTQLDEYDAVIDWILDGAGRHRGVHPGRVAVAGDGVGGNLATAICMRRRDEGKARAACQVLFYPATNLPTDTPAAEENRSGYYLHSNGIFGFADHYLPHTIDGEFHCPHDWLHHLQLETNKHRPQLINTSRRVSSRVRVSCSSPPRSSSPTGSTPCEMSASPTQASFGKSGGWPAGCISAT